MLLDLTRIFFINMRLNLVAEYERLVHNLK